jgi:small-conductance mechanosensitive channel
MTTYSLFGDPVWDALLAAALAALAALIAHGIIARIITRVVSHRPVAAAALRRARNPTRWIFVLLAVQFVLEASPPDLPFGATLRHATGLALIVCVTWFAYCTVHAIADAAALLHPSNAPDNLEARRVQTQARVLSRVVATLIIILGIASALMTFPQVRQVGTALLASAGVAGIILGFAARPMLGNAIAGIQIALTQPIRIDDVVIVEGEWGRIEEITGSYVVVAIWDERRLIVPLTYFLEKPFQNWTRNGSQISGTFELWVDYSMPVEAVRRRFLELVKADEAWDGRIANLMVTGTTERTIKLRGMVSAANAGKNFELRARLREQLVAYIRETHPEALPRQRVDSGDEGESPRARARKAAATQTG